MRMTAPKLPLGRPQPSPFYSRAIARRHGRPKVSSPEVVGAAVLALALLAVLAFVARRRLLRGVAAVAETVEEVADTVEDAAEDLAEAARDRADGSTAD